MFPRPLLTTLQFLPRLRAFALAVPSVWNALPLLFTGCSFLSAAVSRIQSLPLSSALWPSVSHHPVRSLQGLCPPRCCSRGDLLCCLLFLFLARMLSSVRAGTCLFFFFFLNFMVFIFSFRVCLQPTVLPNSFFFFAVPGGTWDARS